MTHINNEEKKSIFTTWPVVGYFPEGGTSSTLHISNLRINEGDILRLWVIRETNHSGLYDSVSFQIQESSQAENNIDFRFDGLSDPIWTPLYWYPGDDVEGFLFKAIKDNEVEGDETVYIELVSRWGEHDEFINTPIVITIAGDKGTSEVQEGLNLEGNSSDNILKGNAGDNYGNDLLIGKGGDDQLFGYRGADVLDGGKGDDLLRAGNGRDVIDGGKGNDAMYGGFGLNTFEDSDDGEIDQLFFKSDQHAYNWIYDKDDNSPNGEKADKIMELDPFDEIFVQGVETEELDFGNVVHYSNLGETLEGIGIYASGTLEAVYIGEDLNLGQIEAMTQGIL